MTKRLQPAEFLDVRRLRLVEVVAPGLSPDHQAARDRVWDEAVEKNPALFDGPVVACVGAEWDGPHGLVLRWTSVTYRHYALRWVPGGTDETL
ncbi:hypothetical protein GCM10009550_41620 [Actinocorallia libanotica]|uniref:Uncharacterized protein n=1 Tax=Actinocorallia libanotica TaxID=46162 RepID=A0ABN1RFA3_9ACTN